MGLLDRLNGAKQRLWSPITVWMAETGSDKLVRAGEPALVVVEVQGEDDGTAERVELFLKLVGLGIDSKRTWPLAEVPKVVGRHELRVTHPDRAAAVVRELRRVHVRVDPAPHQGHSVDSGLTRRCRGAG